MSAVRFALHAEGMKQSLREMVADIEEHALRPAAHQGALVLYHELQARVPVKEGVLQSSVYRWHDERQSRPGRQVYVIGTNKQKAPHWHLIEYGHWQYFVTYRGADGGLYTAVRPEMRGLPPPKGRASLAEKMAYYVPLKGGPKWVPPKPFLRPAWEAKKEDAFQAAIDRMWSMINGGQHGVT